MNRKLIAVLLILFLATLACGLDSSVPFPGDLQSQVDYLNAIHFQIGGNRLALWISLLINGFNLESYARNVNQNGQYSEDLNTLGMFASVGLTESDRTPKAALGVWDSFRTTPL